MNTECEVMNIFSFDGQTVWLDRDTAVFEVGNFLGGGAAGNVYECEHVATQQLYALKILNPIGYKILSPALLRKCNVLVKGKVFNDTDKSGGVLKPDNIWWLLSSSNKQYIAGYFSEKYNSLKELSLNQCIQLWGTELPGVADEESEGGVNLTPLTGAVKTYVPNYPPKFVDFIRRRNRIFREIKNMRKISNHKNVILLESVLELIQESKCTIFLVMELANGGELFDRIKLDCGAREDTANAFFQQLLLGVKHCHDQGVCHRDLKPENLLLQDNTTETVLKIADFGFSARFAMSFDDSGRGVKDSNPAFASSFDDSGSAVHAGSVHTPSSSFLDESPLRVLKSVVGSPFYVAPEVMQAHGYDGCKADVWSLGVILYAMLAGNLPFSQELSICKRFRHFCKWVREESVRVNSFLENVDAIEFPQWLFPARFSNRAKGLIVSMLHPDPDRRITVADAMNFPLCLDGSKPPSDSSHAKGPSVVPEGIAEIADNNANNNNDDYDEDADEEAMQVDSRVDSVEDGQMFEMEEDKCVVETRERPPMPVAKKLTFSDESAGVLQQQQQQAAAARKEKVSSGVSMPPLARLSIVPLKDLINVNSADDDESPFYDSPISGNRDRDGGDESTTPRNRNNGGQPPNFNDLVKRSTRFITAVPAAMVLDKIETILEKVKFQRIATAIGFIGKVELNWDRFCLEVWGLETHGPPLCSLYIYQLQPNDVPNTSASALYSSPHTGAGYATEQQPLHLVEFVRGQLEIFAFKRFYEWVRQELSELVKRDYSLKFFDQASSPVVGGLYFPKR